MVRKEKTKLLENYITASEAFLDSLVVLSTKTGTPHKPDFERLQQVSEANRMKSEDARAVFERHITAHRCWFTAQLVHRPDFSHRNTPLGSSVTMQDIVLYVRRFLAGTRSPWDAVPGSL